MATIQGVYVALFGRPADPTGLNYFNGVTGNGADLTAIGDLASTQEYKDRFANKSSTEIITSIYQSLFNRNPEQAGLDFFVKALADGTFNINNIAIAILDGATGSDKTLVDKKIAAADLYTAALDTPDEIASYQGNAAAAQGITYLEAVTAASATPTAAAADTAVAALAGGVTGGVFTLTTTVGESVIGNVGNDTFSATVDVLGLGGTPAATLNNGDNVDGKDGVDTINILSTSGAATVPTTAIKNVEIVNLVSDVPGDSFAAGTATVGNFDGVQQLWQKGGAASQAVLGLTDAVTAGFDTTAVNDIQMATGATTANVMLSNVATGGTIEVDETVAGTLTTVNVNGSVAGAGALTIDVDAANAGVSASAETTVNVGLSTSGTIVITSASATTNDFSASTGNITSVGSAAVKTVKGGSGNDAFTTAAATVTSVDGGAGNDTIDVTASTGAVTVKGGAGVDTMTGAGGAVVTTFEFDAGDTGLTAATADTIAANFTTTQDKLDFNLAAGSATNFLSGGASSGFTDGLTNANTAFNGTVQYFFTNVGANGILFVDNDLDGTADMAVQLTGVAAMAFGDIIA